MCCQRLSTFLFEATSCFGKMWLMNNVKYFNFKAHLEPPKIELTFLGQKRPFHRKWNNPKKAKLWKGGGMFEFHRNEPPSQLCRVLRSPSDRGQKKIEIFFQDLYMARSNQGHSRQNWDQALISILWLRMVTAININWREGSLFLLDLVSTASEHTHILLQQSGNYESTKIWMARLVLFFVH